MTVLQVEGVSKNFGGLSVLKDVSFTVEAGEKLALIGPNGAGKSTLLNVIGGQLSTSSGKVTLGGRDITSIPPNKRLHEGLGRSYQVNNLFFELSILDNVLLAHYGAERAHFRMLSSIEKRGDLRASAEVLLEAVGLWDKRLQTMHTLSYGDQRLVELALAYAASPKMVLLDEPSAGLPTAEASSFADIVRKLSPGISVLFCAHDMDLVFSLADNIMVLNFGEVLCTGTPDEVSCNVKVQECYLGVEGSC